MIQSPKILLFQEYFSPGYLAGGMQTASFHFLSGANSFNIRIVTSNIDLNKVIKDSKLTSVLDFSYFTGFINSIINFMADMGMGLVSVFFITFFFIKDQTVFKDQARRILPDSNEDKILNSITKINHLLTRYFIGLLLQLIVVFILYLIVLLIFGNKNAFVIAFLSFSVLAKNK